MITVIDTETAGFNGPIMQTAFEAFEMDTFELMYSSRALVTHQFDYEVEPEAHKVHGLTYKQCQLDGHLATDVLEDIVWQLNESKLIVGHNLAFDLRMIAKDCKRYGVPFDFTMTDPRMVCTMAATKQLCNLKDKSGKIKPPSLSELHYRLFSQDFNGAHDALNDVRATARCYFELKKRGIV